jgi:predicted metalloprotease
VRWIPGSRSSDIEDRRSGGMGRSLGIGGTAVVLVLSLVFGRNLFSDLGVTPPGGSQQPLSAADSAREEANADTVSYVLDDAQQSWASVFPASGGGDYRRAKLVLFRGSVQSGCGAAQSAMGPFYCPLDEKVYIDLGFYDELSQRFGAAGDFAKAYVIAHEIGHHVQHLLGTDEKVRQLQQQRSDLANALSVKLELQADCYAGVWGHSAQQRNILEKGDVEEGLSAAAAVGDDRIQQQSGQTVNVDAFTHGSAQERTTWFKRGFESGDMRMCDTFAGGT